MLAASIFHYGEFTAAERAFMQKYLGVEEGDILRRIGIDPPRAGMHDDVIKTILRCLPERIVYVSCNPATQARDLSLVAEHYRILAVQPVDMFPHTHHVENVVKLERI